MGNISIHRNKIALFTIAVGKDPIYFDSVQRYFPYNKENFGQDHDVDYYVFTDRAEIIEGITSIPCQPSVWPYTTMLKNNIIFDYLESTGKWGTYSHLFFIDADFAIGDKYDFFSPDFILVKPYWNDKNGGGLFYGGKTQYFQMLCRLFYDEIRFIYDHKLSVPRDLDEFYLGLFREQYREHIHLIEMDRQTNTLIFYDNEELDEKIQQQGKRLFMQPYKAKGRANKTIVIDVFGNRQECIINVEEQYIFNNYTYDFGRLLKLDDVHYRILWSKQPELREALNIKTLKINKQTAGLDSNQTSPIISIVMPVYNVKLEYLQESIESILKQTFADFELLIIDDGSTETQGIEWLETLQDPRIRLIRNQHDFINSLNRGIVESQGKYIARMDADDIMLPHRLQVQYNYMEEHSEIDVCGSWVEIFGMKKRTIQTHTDHKQIVTSMLQYNPMSHPSIIIRKSRLNNKKQLYKYNYLCTEDYKLWTDLIKEGKYFANIPQVLLLSRSSENQVTKIRSRDVIETNLKIRIEYVEWAIKQILDKEAKFEDFFDNLINLVNEDITNFNRLSNIVYHIYLDYYDK
jgi:glycosyltransferase involved in cell wall biosynthesis